MTIKYSYRSERFKGLKEKNNNSRGYYTLMKKRYFSALDMLKNK